jgi:hypothetical protein
MARDSGFAMQRVSEFGTSFGTALSFAWILVAACGLGGCNQTTGYVPLAAAVPQAPGRLAWPILPENAACSKELTHFETFLEGETGVGNLNRTVYDKIEIDMSRAANACAAGKDGEARAIVHSIKSTYGYRESA